MSGFYFLSESMRQRSQASVTMLSESSNFPVRIRKNTWEHLDEPQRISKTFTFDDLGQQRFFIAEIMRNLDIHSHDIEINIKQNSVLISTRTDLSDEISELDLEIAHIVDEIYDDALYVVVSDEPSF